MTLLLSTLAAIIMLQVSTTLPSTISIGVFTPPPKHSNPLHQRSQTSLLLRSRDTSTDAHHVLGTFGVEDGHKERTTNKSSFHSFLDVDYETLNNLVLQEEVVVGDVDVTSVSHELKR